MELPFDIIYTIGRHCDRDTRLNLCLASKDFYMSDKEWLSGHQLSHYCRAIRRMLNEFTLKRTKAARVKMAHIIFRFIVLYKHMLKHPDLSKFSVALVNKLEELGETGMCRRKVMKYKKDLGL
jgi:hypothetical protein